jgi:hypothetical protein
LLRKVFGERLNASAETFVEMFAEDGVMEFPYAIASERRIEGREAILKAGRQSPTTSSRPRAKLNFTQ